MTTEQKTAAIRKIAENHEANLVAISNANLKPGLVEYTIPALKEAFISQLIGVLTDTNPSTNRQ